MKQHPFIRAYKYVSTLLLVLLFVGCATEPDAGMTTVPQDEVETTTRDQAPLETTADLLACNTPPLQCCNSLQQANSPTVQPLLGLLGIVVPPTTVVGVSCTPFDGACPSQPACCQNVLFGGLIALGCAPAS